MVGIQYDKVAKEEILAADIPPIFKNFVHGAIEKYNRKLAINFVAIKTSAHTWSNVDGDVLNFTINVKDVCQLNNVLKRQNYTLAVAYISYGFNAPKSEFDEVPFLEQNVSDMVTSFAKVTTSPIWRFVIIHSLQQTNGVMTALSEACNTGVECGIWKKPNKYGLIVME